MGETQEERIVQFLEENETPVVGIREAAWLVCENGAVTLRGEAGARIFRRGDVPVEAKRGDNIIHLVGGPMETKTSLLLNRSDIREFLDLTECIDAIEMVFRQQGEGTFDRREFLV